MIIMAGLVFLMTLTESSIVKIDKLFKGPSLTELVKSPMYTTGDTYGKYNSTIEIKCKNYSGKGLDIDGFIIIADSSEYEKIGNMSKSSFRCEILKSFLPNREPLSSGEFEFAIEKTDTFYILLIICSDSSIQLNAEVRSLNPYGYVSADLLPLIPVIFK
jgi:hypothetical protein